MNYHWFLHVNTHPHSVRRFDGLFVLIDAAVRLNVIYRLHRRRQTCRRPGARYARCSTRCPATRTTFRNEPADVIRRRFDRRTREWQSIRREVNRSRRRRWSPFRFYSALTTVFRRQLNKASELVGRTIDERWKIREKTRRVAYKFDKRFFVFVFLCAAFGASFSPVSIGEVRLPFAVFPLYYIQSRTRLRWRICRLSATLTRTWRNTSACAVAAHVVHSIYI